MPNKFLPPTTTTVTRTAATPIDGEVLYDTDEKKLYYGDGTTLGGKPIGSSTVSDSEFRIQDNGDATKQIAFEASGITTGTTCTLTVSNANGTILTAGTLTDKALYYWDDTAKLMKPIAIGTTDQALIAKPSLDPPFQFGTVASSGRELLTANRTYYVRTDGSDSNNGLTNTSGGAFLTIQKAIDTASSIDISIYDITIQLANGTYTLTANSPVVLKGLVGSGKVIIKGDSTTPSNVKLRGSGTYNYGQALFYSPISGSIGTYEFDGLNFNGGGTNQQGDFYLQAPFVLQIKNCLFDGSTYYVRFFLTNGCKTYFYNNTLGSGTYTAFVQTVISPTHFQFPPNFTTTINASLNITYFALLDYGSSGMKATAHTFTQNTSGEKYFILNGAQGYGLASLPGTGGTVSGGYLYS